MSENGMRVHRDEPKPPKPPKPPTTWPDVVHHGISALFFLGLCALALWTLKS